MNNDRAGLVAKNIKDADDLARQYRELYLQTGTLPRWLRHPVQWLCRLYMRLPTTARRLAREEAEDS